MPDPKSTPGGRPLDFAVRKKMEAAFGEDLSSVRVHQDSAADSAAGSVQAKAFAQGSDIFFSRGAYQPNTPYGQKLLAHELAHVIQQRNDKRVNAAGDDPVAQKKAKRLADEALKKMR